MDDTTAQFSQRDSRWAKVTMGNSMATLRDYGCTITSIARINYLINKKVIDPGKLAKTFKFTNDGLLYWDSVAAIGLKANRVREVPSIDLLKNNAGKMIIELNYTPRHWVAVEGVDMLGKVNVMDPLTGNMSKKNRSEITAYALFQPINVTPVPPTEYEKEVAAAAELLKGLGITNGERPTDMVPRQELWVMLARIINGAGLKVTNPKAKK